MASIDALQAYDAIYTLTFDAGDVGVGKTSPRIALARFMLLVLVVLSIQLTFLGCFKEK